MSDSLAFRLRTLAETTSTNDEVKHALEGGEPEGLAVRALCQTGGYGRQGRAWASPEGGLYLSLLLRPQVEVAALPTLSLVTGLAVRRAAADLLPAEHSDFVQVKWPNDLVVPEVSLAGWLPEPESDQNASRLSFRKLCGISVEVHAGGVCVGVGVNVQPPAAPTNVAVGGKNVPVYLRELGFEGEVGDVAEAVLRAFAPLYCTWSSAGFDAFVDEYAAHAALTGRNVRMVNHAGDVVAQGEVASIDASGRLILRQPDGALMSVSSGEARLA